jgi:hypothetical protein
LFSFTGGATSGQPSWTVGFDGDDALYVSTLQSDGAVVRVAPAKSPGAWTETVLATFTGGTDGRNPTSLVAGSDRVLYGLASKKVGGLVFQLTPPATPGGAWTYATIADVAHGSWGPVSLAPSSGGTLIGAINGDPDFFAGSVFQLTPPTSGGVWTYAELWNFNAGPDRNPVNVVTGLDGALFGALNGGDSSNGSLFKLD